MEKNMKENVYTQNSCEFLKEKQNFFSSVALYNSLAYQSIETKEIEFYS